MNILSHEILIGEGQDPCPNRDIFLDLLKIALKKKNIFSQIDNLMLMVIYRARQKKASP